MVGLSRRCNVVAILLSLITMVGCQGFSSGKSAAQKTPQTTVAGTLAAAPTTITFGNVQTGTSQTQSDTLTNTGISSVTVSQAAVTGSGFTTTGLTLPLTLAPGQSASFSVVFAPQSTGAATGNLALTNDGSGPLNVALSGTGVAAGSLVENPTSFSFGNVLVGSSQTQTETLSNSGGQSLTISKATVSGSGFSISGLSLPVNLAPNQSVTFNVVFAPAGSGAVSGDLSVTVSGSSSTLDLALSGTGTTPATLAASPGSLNFTGVQVGKSQTQTETVQNTGGTSATISQASITGTDFSMSGLKTPLTLPPGQSISFSVTFSPTSTGTFSGNIGIASNASNSNLNIGLSGSSTTAAQGQLSVSPSTINAGNVTVGKSGTQSGTLSASGADVMVSSVSVGSAEFSISGISFPATIQAGHSLGFTVTFSPQSSGVATTQASFSSDASNSPAVATLMGTGVAAPTYSVVLQWTASSSPNIVGYNVYRRTGSSGKFSQINTVLDPSAAYTDSSVVDGQTYYYETTAVNSSQEESTPSSPPVQATIPAP